MLYTILELRHNKYRNVRVRHQFCRNAKVVGENMDQLVYSAEKEQEVLHQWLFQDAVEFEKEKEELKQERRELEKERRQLEWDKEDFSRKVALEEQKQEREKRLFDMKWKLLEKEAANLAKERDEFNYKVREFETSILQDSAITDKECSLLFRGVTNELALKKRYKDLMKIYHPDNIAGDTKIVQEISKQYEEMQTQFRSRY